MEKNCGPLSSVQSDLTPVNGNGDRILEIHNILIDELGNFKETIDSLLTANEAKLALIPVVLYFDELILTNYFMDRPLKWPLLQKKIFNTDNGGEKFFKIADLVLKKEKTDKFVFEVFYFCIKHGFRGKYIDRENKIKEYLEMFELKIKAGTGTI
jgi:type VI secretion system protein ImpK